MRIKKPYVHVFTPGTCKSNNLSVFADGFGGPVKQEYIQGPDGNQIGIRHIITKVTEYDKGAYECKVQNKFGTDQKYLLVNVKLDFGVG